MKRAVDMDLDAAPHPLAWPGGWPRTSSREHSRFGRQGKGLTIDRARREVQDQVRMLGGTKLVISTNIELRNDGLPRSDRRAPSDPGVAVYFRLKGEPKCIPIDKYGRVEENLYAVALCIDAMRGLERWGAPRMVDAAFAGFKALPATAGASSGAWWEVLKVPPGAPRDTVLSAHRELSRKWHPDVEGGDAEQFKRVQEALALSGHGRAKI